MHLDEIPTDVDLVRRLLHAQFPQWTERTIRPVPSSGTDNALYRLDDDLVVRLPRIDRAALDVDKEHRWLSAIAPHLPIAIPVPVARGVPGAGYPWHWSVYRWLAGDDFTVAPPTDRRSTAAELGRFVRALRAIDATGAPSAGRMDVALAERDARTRGAITEAGGLIDRDAVTAAWDAALALRAWSAPRVWVHGDLAPGNLLGVDGRLTAVIDFGGLGLGDPAGDLIVAWNLLTGEARDLFRSTVGVDAATWDRGRGWALSIALVQLPYYRTTNPTLAANARRVIAEVLVDRLRG